MSSSTRLQFLPIPAQLRRQLEANWTLYLNASSLVATTAVTSILGFIFWWLASRVYAPEVVGVASAAIASMTLIGAIGILGLGTLLIGQINREPEQAGSIIITSALVAGGASFLLGMLYAFAAPLLSPELSVLSDNVGNALLFASGVAFTSVTIILDQALIGLLRGGLQLWRNAIFSIAKLGVLYAFALWFASASGMSIYAAWLLGNIISLGLVIAFIARSGLRLLHRPRFRLIRQLGRAALAHHAANLILQAPTLIMPIAVTALVSAATNASFYAAWMIASFAFVIPAHLATVLYAMSAGETAALMAKMRMTMRLSLFVAIPLSGLLLITANLLLALFGEHYAEQASWCLRLLALGVFPLIVKYHYIALIRVYSQLDRAIVLLLTGSILEVVFAVVGLQVGALAGLAAGWVIAVSIQAVIMWPRLRQVRVPQ